MRGGTAALLFALGGCSAVRLPPREPTPPPGTETAAPAPAPEAPSPTPGSPTAGSPTPGSPTPGPPALDEATLMAHVGALAAPELRGRAAGTADERAAATYLVGELARGGLAPGAPGYLQPFPFSDGESANVVAHVPGAGRLADEAIVFGAHYDHLGERGGALYLGAEDNASGVAVVLSIAQRYVLSPPDAPRRSLVVVFFGAEEAGLWGSKHYAASPTLPLPTLRAMVNVDMIGRPLLDDPAYALPKTMAGMDGARGLGVLGTADRPVFRHAVDAGAAAAELEVWAPEDLPGPLRRLVENLASGRGDNFSFEAVGIPSLFFGAGESADYHQPTDTPDRLDPRLMAARAVAIDTVIRALVTAPELP
ncbi:MAG: M28 family peptidase [Polyangiaceae bacterium]